MEKKTKMQIKSKLVKLSIATLTVLLCLSCTDATIAHQYETIPKDGWNRDNILNFDVEVDSTELYSNIDIELSYNNNYPYSNLHLFVSAIDSTANKIFSDTINITLADEYGKWLGDGWGSSYQQVEEYKKGYSFPSPGNYKIKIQQGMRDNPIVGIEKVGVRLVRY